MSDAVIDELDKILAEFESDPLYHEFHHHEPLFQQAFEMGKALGLFAKSDLNISLEELGYTVIAAGGYRAWYNEKKRREDEVHQAVLDSSKATIDAAKSSRQSKNAAWFSGIFGAVAVLITIYQLWKGNETDTQLNALTKRVESIDSLMKVQRQNQTANGQKGYRALADPLTQQAFPRSGSPVTEGTPQR